VARGRCGNLINPLIVEGRFTAARPGHRPGDDRRGRLQRDGQLVTGSFMDYALPRAIDFPRFELDPHVTPTPVNPLGAKGCRRGRHARLDAEHRRGRWTR
jgi:carbon-monoxide dehydrogenase large subunit